MRSSAIQGCIGDKKQLAHPKVAQPKLGAFRPRICHWFRYPIRHECQTAQPKGRESITPGVDIQQLPTVTSMKLRHNKNKDLEWYFQVNQEKINSLTNLTPLSAEWWLNLVLKFRSGLNTLPRTNWLFFERSSYFVFERHSYLRRQFWWIIFFTWLVTRVTGSGRQLVYYNSFSLEETLHVNIPSFQYCYWLYYFLWTSLSVCFKLCVNIRVCEKMSGGTS